MQWENDVVLLTNDTARSTTTYRINSYGVQYDVYNGDPKMLQPISYCRWVIWFYKQIILKVSLRYYSLLISIFRDYCLLFVNIVKIKKNQYYHINNCCSFIKITGMILLYYLCISWFDTNSSHCNLTLISFVILISPRKAVRRIPEHQIVHPLSGSNKKYQNLSIFFFFVSYNIFYTNLGSLKKS